MDWFLIVVIILDITATFLLGLFLKNYLPSYMQKKGENLATKEDIQEITQKTEEVQAEFKEKFELFSSDIRFKYDFYYKQYSELYSKLYAIVMQSEYVRRYIKLINNQSLDFVEVPFIEISPTHKETQTITINKVVCQKQDIETALSQFNKLQICEYIIEKGELASPQLLKAAVSYRFVHERYDGNYDNIAPLPDSDIANDEEIRLLQEIIICIVKEYNLFRKELNMEYNIEELESGIPQL